MKYVTYVGHYFDNPNNADYILYIYYKELQYSEVRYHALYNIFDNELQNIDLIILNSFKNEGLTIIDIRMPYIMQKIIQEAYHIKMFTM